MLLEIESYRKDCLLKLAKKMCDCNSPQGVMLLAQKCMMISEAQSITDIATILEYDIKADFNEEFNINVKKAKQLASKYNELEVFDTENKRELNREMLETYFLNGLSLLCAMRACECLSSALEYTSNYLKVLEACYKKDGFCPCKIPAKDTFCPCVEHLDEIKELGHCHCNMFKA